MREYEAQENGYTYCGPSISAYPRQREIDSWDRSKAIAKRLKKEYIGADYVIVSGSKNGWLSQGSKAIYGNDVFNRLWHALAYTSSTPESMIAGYESRKQRIQAEYERDMKEVESRIAEQREIRNWIESIRK